MDDGDLRQARLRKARAILCNEKFRTMSQEAQGKILNRLLVKGLALADLKMLLAEVVQEERSYDTVPAASNNDIAYLQSLPYDIFVTVIARGNIAGADLIRLCNSSKILTGYCNRSRIINDKEQKQFLFRVLLQLMGKSIGSDDNARDLYIYYTVRVPILFRGLEYKLKRSGTLQNIIMSFLRFTANKAIRPKNIYELLYDYKVFGLLAFTDNMTYSEGQAIFGIFNGARHIIQDPTSEQFLLAEKVLISKLKQIYPSDDSTLINIIIRWNGRRFHKLSKHELRHTRKLKHIRRFGNLLSELQIRDPSGYLDIVEGLRKHGNFDEIMLSAANENRESSSIFDEDQPYSDNSYEIVDQFKTMLENYIKSQDMLGLTDEELLFVVSLHRRFLAGELDLATPFELASFQ